MTENEIIGGLSVVIGFVGEVFYLWQIYRGRIKPHLFSWIIWVIILSVDFAAQYVEKSGPGTWALATSITACLFVIIAACYRGEKYITKGDWAAFIMALLAIPVWLMTDNPLWAVIMITGIEVVSIYPTFRKSWIKPVEEGVFLFSTGAAQFLLSIFAQENITWTTALYPASVVVVNMSLVCMLLYRRRVLT